MRTYDMTPLLRSTIGFDRLFNDLMDSAGKAENGYPPFNVELLGENDYRITLAVAGFAQDDLEIEVTDRALKITGRRPDDDTERQFLHHGIAGRSFERRFQLAEHVKVTGASLENGLLNVELAREVPEAMKPRKVEIGTGRSSAEVIEAKTRAA
ncbi:Hsp20 family protein [Parvularcula oceani]|uniref:Hsp20 family protein n=1 Tax=Parvularcula oceani TaxID=1247963 RepID=UPI0004E1AC4E|nr:Hsp20 family protein [Parvularcula oceani]